MLFVLILGLFLPRPAFAQGSSVTVDSDNILLINGQKKFTIGFSPGPPNNSVTPDGKDSLQEFRDAGALLFRIVQTNSWNSQLIASQSAALDWAGQHGMYIWLNLAELSEFASTNTTTAASLRNIVDVFRNHPALGLWKNYDEAWWSGISVTNLLNGYNVIKQEDTNHPVVQTHACRGTVADLQPYNVAADVLALDIYPVVASGVANNPPVTNTQVSQVGDWTDVLGQVANGQKEYWLIEQIAFSGTTPPAHTLIFPTYTQSRFMAYQAINDGARGLMFFGGNIAATLNQRDATLGWNWTFWTNVLKPIVQQLGDKGVLAKALVAPESTLPVTFTGTTAPDIEFCVREAPPYVYLLASKREGATVNVTFSGLPSWAGVGEVLFESPRTVTVTDGQFTDQFAPWDVHVYRFAQQSISPSFITPPQNQTNLAGTTAMFWTSADGTGPLSYQWTRNGVNLADGGNISGVHTEELTVANVSQGDAASYAVIITGTGSITSAPWATLSIITNYGPVILTQPANQTNSGGSSVTFTVTASGPGTLTYQWFKNGISLTNGANIFGAQTAALTVSNISSSDVAPYSVVVSNGYGSQTSYNATLTVLFPMPFYDPFNYPYGMNVGGLINAQAVPWADVGTATSGPYITIASNNLNVSGLAPSYGYCIQFGGNGKSARFSFPGTVISAGTAYYSFAFQVQNIGNLSTSGNFVAGFNNTTGTQTAQPSVVGTRLYLRSTNGGYNIGVSKNSSTTTDWVWDPRTFYAGQTEFIVGSYTFNPNSGGDDVSKIWINPAPSAFGAATEPGGAIVASNNTDITGSGIESFVFFQRSTAEPALMLADELRIGTNWASVTPPPPPIILTLTDPSKFANGGPFRFIFSSGTSQTGSIYGSTNLRDWNLIGPASLVSPGLYQFIDTNASNYPRRFYEIRSP